MTGRADAKLLLELVERVAGTPRHGTVAIPLADIDLAGATATLRAWCLRAGHELLEVDADHAVVRKGPPRDRLAQLPRELAPGTRLWIYTNFHCNLACDYCCVRSSPQAAPRALTVEQVRRLVAEAVEADVGELILTGGEPFLLPDLEHMVAACTAALPTTLLTNGMLLRGHRFEALQRMDRRLTLQISLDSATPGLHDHHRGAGSWAKAVAGIQAARAEGFRVKVAATLPAQRAGELDDFRAFLESLGVPREDHLVRALAKRGYADEGVDLTITSLVPEVTVTADGIFWHPVAATDDDMLISRDVFPLSAAIGEVRRRYTDQRAEADAATQWFPCA